MKDKRNKGIQKGYLRKKMIFELNKNSNLDKVAYFFFFEKIFLKILLEILNGNYYIQYY